MNFKWWLVVLVLAGCGSTDPYFFSPPPTPDEGAQRYQQRMAYLAAHPELPRSVAEQIEHSAPEPGLTKEQVLVIVQAPPTEFLGQDTLIRPLTHPTRPESSAAVACFFSLPAASP